VIDYDQAAAAYARNRRLHPEVLRRLLAGARLDAASAVLEVGCGTGNYLLAVAGLSGAAGWGIDPSEEMLTRAGERLASESFSAFDPPAALGELRGPLPAPAARAERPVADLHAQVSLRLGRAERLEFLAGAFDLVFSVDVIHHVGDRAAFFAEVRRVLKPAGRLCTVTDSEAIIRRRMPLSAYFPETVDVELRRYPPMATLRAEMASAGFGQIVEETAECEYLLEDARAYREKAFSSLHLISPEAHAAGLARLDADLRAGPLPCVARYTMLWGT